MTDSRSNLSSQAHSLSKLLGEQALPRHVWSDDEVGAVLLHQWRAPLRVSLEGLSPQQRDAVRHLADADQLLVRSFGDLLAHPSPPLELLVIMKDFAKAIGLHPASPLPPDAARVMYLGAIAAARVRCRQRISSLSDPELIDGLRWTLSRPWISAEIARVYNELEDELNEGRTGTPPEPKR